MKGYLYPIPLLVISILLLSCGSPALVAPSESNTNNNQSAQNKNSSPTEQSATNSEQNKDSNPTGQSTTHSSSKNGKIPENRTLPPDIAKVVQEAGIPLYSGNTPPMVEGYYRVSGTVTASKHGRSPGAKINSYVSLTNQTPENSIQYEEVFGHIFNLAKGRGWIMGQNNKFTIYNLIDRRKRCSIHTEVISGTKKDRIILVGRQLKKEVQLYIISLVYNHEPSKCAGQIWEKHSTTWVSTEKPSEGSSNQGSDDPHWREDPGGPPPLPFP